MEQKEFKFCNYPGCQEHANPIFKDEKHGGIYCVSHCFRCGGCSELHGKQEETDLDIGSQFTPQKRKFCKDCFDSNTMMQCPNCREVIAKEEFLEPQNGNTYSMKNGGCKNCAYKCSSCDKIVNKDTKYCFEDQCYCEDCFYELFHYCEECNDYVTQEDMIYIDKEQLAMCSSCYKQEYTKCYECDKEVRKDDAEKYDDEYYCDKCINLAKTNQHKKLTDKLPSFTYTSKDKYLNQLQKLLPISVKKLKTQYPFVVAGLSDLISFSKGKDLTDEMVYNYRVFLDPENFPVKYQTWDGLQRSIDNSPDKPEKEQLVLIIEAGKNMAKKLGLNDPLSWLFSSINSVSENSGHPSTPEMIGWARLELDPNGEYILVDEIQSDHLNAAHSLKNSNSEEIRKIQETIKTNFHLNDEQFKVVLNEYYNLLKEFPQIANQAITKFAKENVFKKIYWHTYESGKKLKQNDPPKSLYTKLPKEHGYNETENRPFNLPGKFFEREARVNYLKRLTKDSKCPEKTMLSGKL